MLDGVRLRVYFTGVPTSVQAFASQCQLICAGFENGTADVA